MKLSQIDAMTIRALGFNVHEKLFKQFIAQMETQPEKAILSTSVFYNLLEGKGLDSDIRYLAVEAFAKMSKGLAPNQISEVIDNIYAQGKSILIEQSAVAICRENPQTAVHLFSRLLHELEKTAKNKTRATTVLDNTRINQIAQIITYADDQDSLWMWQRLNNSYPAISNMIFSKLGEIYKRKTILRTAIWEQIKQQKIFNQQDFYRNLYEIAGIDSSKADACLAIITERRAEPHSSDELKWVYHALGAIRKNHIDKNAVDEVFAKVMQNPFNSNITLKVAYRNMEQKDKLRSRVEIGERIDKSQENEYGFKIVEDINPDETAVLFLGGSSTKSDSSANGYLSSVEELLKESQITQKVKLYAAIYDFGDELDRDAYFNDSMARSKLMEQYHHDVPIEHKFGQASEDTLHPRYVEELFVRMFLPKICDENGQKLSLSEACRKVRKTTVITHCHGAYTFIKIEELMQNKMRELGYTSSEMAKIQHELLCIAHAPFAPLGVAKSTMISFGSADDDMANHYNNFYTQIRSMPDRNVLFSYFPKERGELILVPSLGHKVEQHNFIGYDFRQSGLSKDGQAFVSMSANAVIGGIKSSLNNQSLPPVKDLLCGQDGRWDKLFARLEQNGEKMWDRIKERAIKQHKKQRAIKQKNSSFLAYKDR